MNSDDGTSSRPFSWRAHENLCARGFKFEWRKWLQINKSRCPLEHCIWSISTFHFRFHLIFIVAKRVGAGFICSNLKTVKILKVLSFNSASTFASILFQFLFHYHLQNAISIKAKQTSHACIDRHELNIEPNDEQWGRIVKSSSSSTSFAHRLPLSPLLKYFHHSWSSTHFNINLTRVHNNSRRALAVT